MLGFVKKIAHRQSVRRQLNSTARNPSLWSLDVHDKGHLTVDGVDAAGLLTQFGSPLLVVQHRLLVQHAQQMVDALAKGPTGSRVYYSYKTNCIPGILAELHRLGIGAEVISPYELWLAHELGVDGDAVIFNGVDKTDDSIDLAVRMNVAAINVDHLSEIDRIAAIARRRGQRARVGVRLGLVEKAQFGLSVDDGECLEACRRILDRPGVLELSCVHFNVTSNARNSATHRAALARALQFLDDLKKACGVEVPLLDIGGGFGVPTTKNMSPVEYLLYRGLGLVPEPPRPDDFQPIDGYVGDLIGDLVSGASRLGLAVPALAVEPGRYITSRSEFLLTTVKTVKTRGGATPIAITDAGRLSVTFPCDFE
jgi:diaminopimelate decarboxylase